MDTRPIFSPVRILSIMLCVTVLWLLYALLAWAADPAVYWHAASNGLPSDVQALAAAPFPPGTPGLPPVLYAGTWGDGVFRSTDHGATWQPASTAVTLPLYIQGGLAVNPVTPTILYAGDYYGGGLYRSADGGDSWSLSLPGASIRAVAVHPLTPTIVLAGDRERGLYRSADAGDTWTPITATAGTAGLIDTHVRALAFAPTAPNVAYAGASQFIFRSDDAGQSWTLTGTLPSNVHSLAVHPVTPSLVYAGTFAHGLHRSADGGAHWTPLTDSLPSDAWVTSLAIYPVSPTILYAGTWDGQVYRSADGGDSWQGLGYLGYVYGVLVHPTAPGVIYAATSNHGVFRGSTLDHLTIEPVDSPQCIKHAFPITLTARDALGFPLTGAPQAQLAALARTDPALAETLAAGGFDGTATLTDTTGTITPTLVALSDGIACPQVTIGQEATGVAITATLSAGPAATSNPFDVGWYAHLYLPLITKMK